jgi:hypothetical protein
VERGRREKRFSAEKTGFQQIAGDEFKTVSWSEDIAITQRGTRSVFSITGAPINA